MSEESKFEELRDQEIRHRVEDVSTNDAEIGATIGGVGGAAMGAVAGSVVGPAGTVIGAIVGGVVGAAASGIAVAAVDSVDQDGSADETPRTITYGQAVTHGDVEAAEGVENLESRQYVDDDVDSTLNRPSHPSDVVPIGDYAVEQYENRTYDASLGNWDGSRTEEEIAEGLAEGRIDDTTGKPLD